MQKNMDFKEVCRSLFEDLGCYKVFTSEENMILMDC